MVGWCDPWGHLMTHEFLIALCGASVELHSSIFSSSFWSVRRSGVADESLQSSSLAKIRSRRGAEQNGGWRYIYLVDLVVERGCNILNSKRSSSTRSEEMKMIDEEDMWEIWTWPRMSQWIQDLLSNIVQPFRKAVCCFGRPPNSLEDVVYSTAEFPMGFIERLGDSKQSGMIWPYLTPKSKPNCSTVDRILNCQPY